MHFARGEAIIHLLHRQTHLLDYLKVAVDRMQLIPAWNRSGICELSRFLVNNPPPRRCAGPAGQEPGFTKPMQIDGMGKSLLPEGVQQLPSDTDHAEYVFLAVNAPIQHERLVYGRKALQECGTALLDEIVN